MNASQRIGRDYDLKTLAAICQPGRQRAHRPIRAFDPIRVTRDVQKLV
jgi:hypothetical protein